MQNQHDKADDGHKHRASVVGHSNNPIRRLRRGWALAALAVALGFAAAGGGILLPASTAQAQSNQDPNWPQFYVPLDFEENKSSSIWYMAGATDPDGDDSDITYTYSGSGSDHISVSSAGDGTMVRVTYSGVAFDYETMDGYQPAPGLRTAYSGSIKATDADGGHNYVDVSILVRNVREGDEAFPVLRDSDGNSTDRYQFSLRENADGSGTPIAVGSVTATDANNDDLIYSLEAYDGTDNPPAPPFSINDGGEISYTGGALDYESLLEEGEDEVTVQLMDVTATDSGGLSDTARVVVLLDDVEVPARMNAPTVEYAPSAGNLRLSWTPPSNADAADLTNWRYTYQPTGSTDSSERVIHTVTLDATSLIVDGMSAGSYDFWVRAEGSEGFGHWSESTTFRVVDPPSKLPAPTLSQGQRGELLVSWPDPEETGEAAPDGFRMRYRPVGSGPDQKRYASVDGADARSFTLRGLTPGTEYQVRVRAVNAAGKGDWSKRSIEAPHGFHAGSYRFDLPENADGSTTAVSVGQVNLSGDAEAITYSMTAGDATKFSVDGASGEITYVGSGEDHESNPDDYVLTVSGQMRTGHWDTTTVTVAVTDIDEPPSRMPAAPSLDADGDGVVDVTWTAMDNEDGKPSVTGYVVRYRTEGTERSSVKIRVSGSLSTTAQTENGLSGGVTYRFRVAAVNDEGRGRWSQYASITIPESVDLPPQMARPTVSHGIRGSVVVGWTAPDIGDRPAISQYVIRWRRAGGTPIVDDHWKYVYDATATSATLRTGLTPGVEHHVWIAAGNSAGRGEWSPHATITPQSPQSP